MASRKRRETSDDRQIHKEDSKENSKENPEGNGPAVAVVGMACTFPGAADLTEFWSRLGEGHDSISEVPASRFDIEEFYDPCPGKPGKIVSRWGGFLDGIDEFDADFFGVAPREAHHMDPQQRLLLETTAAAAEDAGFTRERLADGRTGVFIGSLGRNYWDAMSRSGVLDIYANAGSTPSVLSGRLSYAFDLQGPSLTVDTACSSSLTAVHLACQSLRGGESTLALAGGVNLILVPEESITFSSGKMLSPDGRCKFASASANGFVRSEGVGVVVLKLLKDAIADGDAVRAVILGSATVNDGRSGGAMMAPARSGQEKTLRAAYADAGIHPSRVDYVEAHGTGTPVGDPVELGALAAVLGADRPADRPLIVGSVKTNIGHAEGAAGIAGLIKAVMCLEHGVIPPSLHSAELTSAIDWANTPLHVPQRTREWPQDERPGIAGVSSFGISGTNVHIVLGAHHPARTEPAPATAPEEDGRPRLLSLSSHSPETLRETAARYLRHLEPGGAGHETPLRDICYSAATRRDSHESRLTVVGSTRKELTGRLSAFLEDEPGPLTRSADEVYEERSRVVFVFPGQGSQWVGMGRELLTAEPVFRRALEECDAAVRAETGWSVMDRLTGGGALEGVDVIQPTLWAVEVALAALWRSWGVEPDYVVGHSMGEAAAACVAGSLGVADAAAVICRRSALAKSVSGNGAMASVELGAEDAAEELSRYAGLISVAAINGPTSTVLSGDGDAMRELLTSLQERGVFCRLVRVDFASHGPQVEPLREPLLEALGSLAPRAGSVPMYSTVDAEPVDGTGLDAAYWARNLREPVRFGPVVQKLLDEGPTVFIEISPHPILTPAMSEYAYQSPGRALAVGSTRRNTPELAALLDSLAAVRLSGHPVDLGRIFEPEARYVRLPGPAWQRQRYWFPERPTSGTESAAPPAAPSAAPPGHPLLGAPVADAGTGTGTGGDRVWEGPLDLTANAYLRDHQVQGVVIIPGTAYIEMAAAAAATVFGTVPAIRDVTYHEGIFLTGSEPPPVVRVTLRQDPEGGWGFEIGSRHHDQSEHRRNVTGLLDPGEGPPAAARAEVASRERARSEGAELPGEEFYRRFAAKGNQWLGAFRGVTRLWRRDGEALARIEPPASVPDGDPAHHFHPALLDACGHTLAAAFESFRADGEHDAFVLGGIDRVRLHRRPRGPVWSHAVRTEDRPDAVVGDVEVRDEDGELLAELGGVRLRFLVLRTASPRRTDWLHEVVWRPVARPAPGGPRTGFWLVLADRSDTADTLKGMLGGRVIVVTSGAALAKRAPDRYETGPDDYRELLAEVRGEVGDSRCEGIVHLWSRDARDPGPLGGSAAGATASAARLGGHSVLRLTRALEGTPWYGSGLWLVTEGAQRLPDHPGGMSVGQATVWGLGRSLIQERGSARCVLIDLPAGAGRGAAGLLGAELLAQDDGENQIAFRGGRRYTARLVAHTPALAPAPAPALAPALAPEPVTAVTAPAVLPPAFEVRSRTAGLLDELGPVPVERRAPGPGEVAIRVTRTALNYRDVLTAMGAYPGLGDAAPLGWECVGVITELGDGVAGLLPGDEVVALSEGALASHVVTSAHLVGRIPARLTAEEALTLPAAYLTAYYGLCELARLAPGERVLIHSATGGVGLAAIQLARWRGAEIYATAGSPRKRALLKTLGVKHVFDSRSTAFADEVAAATRGDGVDVVLNSLAGDAIPRSLSVLAPYGRYVELSKKDLIENSSIGLLPFSKNLAFFSMDLVDMLRHRPRRAGELLERVLELVEGRAVEPLPYEEYGIADVEAAFRRMARAQHIGKVLVRLDDTEEPAAVPAVPVPVPVPVPAAASAAVLPSGDGGPVLVSDGAYVVTGGLGGIGLKLAAWLVERGARELILLGRSPLGDRAGLLRELERGGARVAYHAVDVADEDALRAVFGEHESAGLPPVRGVLHAAGVIELASAAETEPEQFDAMIGPKVTGAWNLHRLLEGSPLDFFVLFSSASAVLGSPMLGAYAAANAGLDALAHHRRDLGLPALSVNWGFWSSVGMVARYDDEHERSLAPRGIESFTPEEGIGLLQSIWGSRAAQLTVLAADWGRWSAAYPDAARDPLLRELVTEMGPPPPPPPPPPVPVPVPVASVAEAEAEAVTEAAVPSPGPEGPGSDGDPGTVRAFLTQRIAKVLALPTRRLHDRKPLNRQGLDSLMATEVRSQVQREYGVMVPMARMLGGQSLTDLADFITDELAGRA
ncbi:polyketide synthase [Streptomyces inusitatus]|uniref:Polyketide synthase n=1 Tax=Streptomyces inusitatus TaxID=68221 RepID=A0A918V483_9ACTN|nr:type I polyketide synthase [Streptomyces inusitatus]GGZ62388.1 polyketide synthase [Streptomyces inusitatus]